jgi:hypothetical protein
MSEITSVTRSIETTYKESDAHILVVEYLLGISSFKLNHQYQPHYQRKSETYLDQLDDLGERMGISKQLLPNRPILSSLSTMDVLNDILGGGP